MARGINKVILVGNLGADPEQKAMPSGAAVTELRLATTRAWKDRNSGEQREETEWHRVVAYQRLAEIMGQYLRKGSQVYIEGRLRTRKWQDRDGNDRYTTEIVADEMQMLGGRGGGTADFGGGNSSGGGYGGGQKSGGQGGGFSAPQPSAPSGGGNDGGFDDDIPF